MVFYLYIRIRKWVLIFRVASATCLCCLMYSSPRDMAVVVTFDLGVIKSAQLLVSASVKIPVCCSTQHVFSPYLCSHFSLCQKGSGRQRMVQKNGLPHPGLCQPPPPPGTCSSTFLGCNHHLDFYDGHLLVFIYNFTTYVFIPKQNSIVTCFKYIFIY